MILPLPGGEDRGEGERCLKAIAPIVMLQKVCPFSAHQRNDRLMPSSSAMVGL
jgi:hypothetical protein